MNIPKTFPLNWENFTFLLINFYVYSYFFYGTRVFDEVKRFDLVASDGFMLMDCLRNEYKFQRIFHRIVNMYLRNSNYIQYTIDI